MFKNELALSTEAKAGVLTSPTSLCYKPTVQSYNTTLHGSRALLPAVAPSVICEVTTSLSWRPANSSDKQKNASTPGTHWMCWSHCSQENFGLEVATATYLHFAAMGQLSFWKLS